MNAHLDGGFPGAERGAGFAWDLRRQNHASKAVFVSFQTPNTPSVRMGWNVPVGSSIRVSQLSRNGGSSSQKSRHFIAKVLALCCHTEFVRLVVDDQPVPLHLLIEQPNKAFLRHHRLRDDGNLYKATWAGEGIEGTHGKRTNRHTGHEDLVRLVESLERTKDQPEDQWTIIRREFDTEEVINHYAVRTLISDWDGFFNNYYLYHDVYGSRKWTFYPWDEDRTWGEYDGWEQSGPLYEMPLSYGSEGDLPPGEPGGRPSTSYGFREWWRAGGYISRPLLANPTFRGHFLARLKELIDTEFTEDRIGSLVDALKAKLEDEIQGGAGMGRERPHDAGRRFETHLASYRDFVVRRRAFLLSQPEVKNAGPFRRSEIR